MVRSAQATAALTAVLAAWSALSADAALGQAGAHDWSLRFDVTSPSPSTDVTSWIDGSVGKLRYDESGDSLTVGRVLFTYDGRLRPTLSAHVAADYVEDGAPGVDLTEAFVEWRPVPRSANRHRFRFGAFYPELSLENNDPGWTGSYTLSSSAINTWIAEEMRTIGAEWSLERPLGSRASGRAMKLVGALYYGNDPAGTLLAWKGWSIHDRQTRLNDVLPLPPVPQVAPGMMFATQAPQIEPFIETDDRPGFYYGAEWRPSRRSLLTFTHYDNHADPESLRDGQYGWTTRFDHVGAQLELPGDLGLIAQWMDGTTAMGPIMNGARVVDTAFASYFLMLTKRIGKHRVSVRRDDFNVVDRDSIPLDANDETGDAWTLAYRYRHSDRLLVGAEWLTIWTDRTAWTYFGLASAATEEILQVQISYRLGGE